MNVAVVPTYRGRFAPSPTGPLHFGSLVTALGSYLDARKAGGQWLVRIDDIDQTRCIEGMDSQILRTLEAFGLHWDGVVRYQSRTTEVYQEALQQLQRSGLAYRCDCSRSQIKAIAKSGVEGPIYPGTCRAKSPADNWDDNRPYAIRVMTHDQTIRFHDRLYGLQQQRIAQAIGDFVIRRVDGFFAYQLAVVVDDQLAGINQVVRGQDLLSSTPRQIYLQQQLQIETPTYLHLPLVRDATGRKLSKRDQDHPVDQQQPVKAMLAAWHHLGQWMPDTSDISLPDFLNWAITHWQPNQISKTGNPQ